MNGNPYFVKPQGPSDGGCLARPGSDDRRAPTVTDAQPKRRMRRGGKLDVNIDDVRLADGEKVPLRAVKEAKGGSHTGAMTGAIVATAIVFFPAAPLFLLVHGKDITIPKGTEITGYVNGDIPLDLAKFQTQPTLASPVAAPVSKANSGDTVLSLIEVKSIPDGADIFVDEEFAGNTPSAISNKNFIGKARHSS